MPNSREVLRVKPSGLLTELPKLDLGTEITFEGDVLGIKVEENPNTLFKLSPVGIEVLEITKIIFN